MRSVRTLGLLTLLLIATLAAAQKAEIALTAGAAFGADQTGQPDTSGCNPIIQPHCFFTVATSNSGSFAFDASGAVRLAGAGPVSLALELPVLVVPSRKTSLQFPSVFFGPSEVSGSAVFITPSIRVRVFSSAPLSPWVSAGGGWARLTLPNSNTVTNGEDSRSSATLQVGGGLDIRSSFAPLRFRIEIRNYWPETALRTFVTSPSRPHQIYGAGGVVLGF